VPTAAFISFRLGRSDGVSVVAATWMRCFHTLGFETTTVAGDGTADALIPGLALDADDPPPVADVATALAGADLVVVENLLTIPLHLGASELVARVLAGRPAVLHHHDPPWQRDRFAHITRLPATDPAWAHVVINDLTRRQFADRGFDAVTIHNGFDVAQPLGDRTAARRRMGADDDEVLVLHPVRAIERKNVPAALAITADLRGTYWLPGAAEEGYDDVLACLLSHAEVPVRRDPPPGSMADAYAACDVVVFPSTWEGFGNPPVEAAIHRRPAVVGDYPVARELRRYGFRWFGTGEADAVRRFLAAPESRLLDHNRAVVARHFSEEVVVGRLEALLRSRGWLP
jgi:glycosyltransferase involved in cell wall biosynthesis